MTQEKDLDPLDNQAWLKLVNVIKQMPIGTRNRIIARRAIAKAICQEFAWNLEQFMAAVNQ